MSNADDHLAPARRERPPGTLRIGQIAGIDVLVSTTWFLIAALIAVAMAPVAEAARPGLGPWKYVAGFAFAVVLYLSVLMHEAAHALMARRLGYPVDSITLHFLGGVTAIEGESRKPGHEFAIAVVGPLTSLAVGAVGLVLWWFGPAGLIGMTTGGLAFSNLLIGLLNLVPGLPLDGGRLLKAGVWKLNGNMHTGTTVAAWGGRVAAVAVIAWPFVARQWLGWETDFVDILLAVMVGGFLWTGASAALNAARIRRRLPALVARDLARRTLTVPADLPLAEAIRRAQEEQAGSIVTLDSDGTPRGVVNEQALLATPEERRPWVATSTVARSLEPGLTLPVGIAGEDLIRAISRRPAHEYLLVDEEGTIFGVLATADVDQAFRASSH